MHAAGIGELEMRVLVSARDRSFAIRLEPDVALDPRPAGRARSLAVRPRV